ncbi:MAG: response regulator [Candidatus Bathyarchaeia archaeon]|jgi:CheY-like chemotaxis protein
MIQPSPNIRVLLVDDDPCQLELIETAIRGIDKSLIFEKANSGEKALELVHGKHFDCLVSNYIMPRMSGLELFEKLRAEGYYIPFILFTALDDESMAKSARQIGVDDIIEKEPSLTVYNVLAQRIVSLVSTKMHPFV